MTSSLWAPTGADRIERALDLAQLMPGERFADLGCGDGRVLLAAARRGAEVTGIEMDPGRAERARELLRRSGFQGEVVLGDVAQADIDADVAFAFLTPATLQRLAPRLAQLTPGTRLVSPEFGVEGWEPERVEERCFLYRTPPRSTETISPMGWETIGVLVGLRADSTTLIAVKVTPPRGRVAVDAKDGLRSAVSVSLGVDLVDEPHPVVVDVEWKARPAGTVVTGQLDCLGVGSCRLFGIYTHGPLCIWGLPDRDSCARIAARIADPERTAESILEAARSAAAPTSL